MKSRRLSDCICAEKTFNMHASADINKRKRIVGTRFIRLETELEKYIPTNSTIPNSEKLSQIISLPIANSEYCKPKYVK